MTDRDKIVLEAIIALKAEKGYSPTFREIGEKSGLKSTASVAKAINNLIIEGYISDPKYKKRTIEVLKPIKQTIYDRIKAMSVDEMAEAITNLLTAHLNKYAFAIGNPTLNLTETEKAELVTKWRKMLESEVTE